MLCELLTPASKTERTEQPGELRIKVTILLDCFVSSVTVLGLKPGLCAPCEQEYLSNAQETLDMICVKIIVNY